jgi:hypothetical protein
MTKSAVSGDLQHMPTIGRSKPPTPFLTCYKIVTSLQKIGSIPREKHTTYIEVSEPQ